MVFSINCTCILHPYILFLNRDYNYGLITDYILITKLETKNDTILYYAYELSDVIGPIKKKCNSLSPSMGLSRMEVK